MAGNKVAFVQRIVAHSSLHRTAVFVVLSLLVCLVSSNFVIYDDANEDNIALKIHSDSTSEHTFSTQSNASTARESMRVEEDDEMILTTVQSVKELNVMITTATTNEEVSANESEATDDDETEETSSIATIPKTKVKDENSDSEESNDDSKALDDDDYYEVEESDSSVCSAEYFLDKLIPQDYPTPISKDVHHINETIERLNRMYNFSQQIVDRLGPFIREVGSRMSDYMYEAQLETNCMVSLFRTMSALSERKSWALSFMDSTGSLMSGNQEGKFVSLGEYDQCLEITTTMVEENVNNEPIRGQYCLLKPIIPVPEKVRQGESMAQSHIEQVNRFLNDEYIETYLDLYKYMKKTILRIGVCLPDKCTASDVESALNQFLIRKTGLSVQIGNCAKASDDTKLDRFQIIALFTFAVLLFLVVACSCYEVIYRILLDSGRFVPSHSDILLNPAFISTPYSFSSSQHQHSAKQSLRQLSTTTYTGGSLEVQAFTAFSIIRNTRVLFEIPAYRKLPLDTMRLLLVLYTFLINSYLFTLAFAPMVIKRFYVHGPMQFASEKKYFFLRMAYILDCFLAFTGISLVLAFKPRSFSYMKYLLQTYLRYVLPILFSVALIYLIPLFGSGPLWHLFDEIISQPCKANLSPSLLLSNNFDGHIEQVCNLPTMFVSLVFQLQLLGPLFLFTCNYLRPRSSFIFLVIAICLLTVWNLVPRYVFDIKVPFEYKEMKSFSEIKYSISFYIFNPSFHACSLVFGIAAGYVIKERRTFDYSSSIFVGILSLLGLICGHIYVEHIDLFNPNLSMLEVMGLLTFARIPMLIFFCWIIYASLAGHITIVNRFLSAVVWRPLCQLSYGFSILSIPVIGYRLFSIREPTILSAQNIFRALVSDMVVCFILSYLMHILVQQPMRNIRLILLQWKLLFDLNNSEDKNGNWNQDNSNQLSVAPRMDENHNFDLVVEEQDKVTSDDLQFTQKDCHKVSNGGRTGNQQNEVSIPTNGNVDRTEV